MSAKLSKDIMLVFGAGFLAIGFEALLNSLNAIVYHGLFFPNASRLLIENYIGTQATLAASFILLGGVFIGRVLTRDLDRKLRQAQIVE